MTLQPERLYLPRPPEVRRAILAMAQRDTQQPLTLPELARDVIGPTYIPRPHTDQLTRTLQQAVQNADAGNDTKIVISMPPGMGKSQTASVVFPLWLALNRPTWEIGLVSAEASLAVKFSRDVRRAYDRRGTQPSEGGVTDWTIGGTGGVIARGINGGMSGRRLRVAIIDDPIRHMADAYSQRIRDTAWDIWQSVIKPRMRPGSIVLSIATRWHDDDLNGRLLRAGGWEHLVFPALAESDDQLGRSAGQPLLSVQEHETPEEALIRWENTKHEVGSAVFNALYQQHPGDVDGTVFKLDWWRYYTDDELPAHDQALTSWDLTFGTAGDQHGDYCVGQYWQRTGNQYYLVDQIRFRGGFNVQLDKMRRFIQKHPAATKHLVEQAANGAAAIATLQRELDGVVPRKPTASKIVRAQSVSPLAEARQVHLPAQRPWVDETVTELTAFPTGPHDDIVDATSQALTELRASDIGPIVIRTNRPRLPGW